MIRFDELLEKMEEDSKNNNSVRNKNLHLSEVAICGFKYRYRLDNDLFIPFKLEYYVGNSFEFTIVNQLKKMTNIITQYQIPFKYENLSFIGHTDAYDVNNDVIYELKSSFSYNGNYFDIYERQLKAYMIANDIEFNNKSKGVLWYFNFTKKVYKEIVFDSYNYNDSNMLSANIIAFKENRYFEGIENSLCAFCENINCKMKGKKVIK